MILKLSGLDDYDKSYLNEYWKDYDPKKDNPKILGVSLSTSNICNYRCIYCYAGMQKPAPDELTLGEYQHILTQAQALGAKTVILCGDGEPSMDKNLLSIVSHAASLGLTSIVVSNGALFGDDILSNKIHKLDGLSALKMLYQNKASLILKLESLDQQKYESIVGVKGAFTKFMRAIDRIQEVGFNNLVSDKQGTMTTRLAFSAVIMKTNIDELKKLKEYTDNIHAQFICKLPSLVGRALEHIDVMFEIAKYEEIRKELFGYTAKRETLMVDTPRCMAWHYGPCIGVNGDIRECYTSACPASKRIGNIREKSLSELIRNKSELYDVTINDFCPVKTRINKEFEEKGMKRIWNVAEKGVSTEDKVAGY